MNQKIKIVIWIITSIVSIGIIGKVIISNNPVYKFKVDKLFESKDCKITNYYVAGFDKYTYCSHKIIKKYRNYISEKDLYSTNYYHEEVKKCEQETNFKRKINLLGETDCYEDTLFDFLIFRTSDNKIISKGYIIAGTDRFSLEVDTSIPDVGNSYISCNFEGILKEDCSDNEYQVLFK